MLATYPKHNPILKDSGVGTISACCYIHALNNLTTVHQKKLRDSRDVNLTKIAYKNKHYTDINTVDVVFPAGHNILDEGKESGVHLCLLFDVTH